MDQYVPQAKKLLNFIDKSVSPYHAVESARTILEGAGFQLISENSQWNLKAGGKYFFTRNQSTIIAFAIGHKFKPGNGFNIVGAHTDSPNLKVKPKSAVSSAGLAQVGVELYGGGLWHTWFDRDLTVAGRVLVKVGDKFESRLVKIEKPLLRIPTLAIHLDRSVNTDGFKYNTQTHLLPVISSVQNQLQGDKADHHPLLLDYLAKQLGVAVSDIQTFDLNLCDTLPGAIGGGLDEFVFSPRLDNLCMSYCSVQALADSVTSPAFQEETGVHTVMLFDNEEVGSNSAQGAASPVILDLIQRVTAIEGSAPNLLHLVDQAVRKSFLISADMAHALHPNYSSLHEPNHQPKMNAGPVIKHNANLRYATTAYSAFVVKELAKSAGVPIQEFVVKNDMACGSTIGPIIATLSGIRTVDIGNPQLSMHSIREQCGVADVTHAIKLLKAFFDQFTTLDTKIKIDE
jgi:aspartyl aminopeptidase